MPNGRNKVSTYEEDITNNPIYDITPCSNADSTIKEPTTEPHPEITEDVTAHLYEIPVVFHVLYKQSNEPTQYVPQSRINTILTKINLFFEGRFSGSDVRVKFVLADKDETDTPLVEKGINRVHVNDTYPINVYVLMSGTDYKHILWNPNDYLNIMLFNFDDNEVLGVSHLPYMNEDNEN